MGEVFHALEALNRTMKLGLSAPELLRAEMGFKSALARQGNPDPTIPEDPVELAEGFELVATLQPRAEALSLRQLSTFARKEVSRPRTKVDARTLKQIDTALAATAATKGAGTATKAKPATAKAPATKAAATKKTTAKKSAAAKAPAKKRST